MRDLTNEQKTNMLNGIISVNVCITGEILKNAVDVMAAEKAKAKAKEIVARKNVSLDELNELI
jgi:hypothetical protein